MHDEVIVNEFSHQAEAFDRALVMNAAETLGVLLEMLPEDAAGRWIEVACGTGIVARALATRVDEVLGIDLTDAMLDVARREASSAGLGNLHFALADASASKLPDASFDGAVTRFGLHHIPVPGRVLTELVRLVRPGGYVILADHVTDEDAGTAAWHQEIERLRDPSHWSCLSPERIRVLGRRAGLELDEERLTPFALDFDEWLTRSTGGSDAARLIALCLAEHPGATPSFAVTDTDEGRRLELLYSVTRWRRP